MPGHGGGRLTLLSIGPNTPHTPPFGRWCLPMAPQGQGALVVSSGQCIAAAAPVRRLVTDPPAHQGWWHAHTCGAIGTAGAVSARGGGGGGQGTRAGGGVCVTARSARSHMADRLWAGGRAGAGGSQPRCAGPRASRRWEALHHGALYPPLTAKHRTSFPLVGRALDRVWYKQAGHNNGVAARPKTRYPMT